MKKDADATNGVTQAEFARRQGWDKSYVTKLKHQGRLVLTDDGLVDVEQSMACIKATTGAPSRASEAVMGPIYADAKERGAHYVAEMARIRYEREIGALCSRAEVEGALADILARMRTTIAGLAERMAPEIVAMSAEDEIRQFILAQHARALEDVAHELLALTQPAAA